MCILMKETVNISSPRVFLCKVESDKGLKDQISSRIGSSASALVAPRADTRQTLARARHFNSLWIVGVEEEGGHCPGLFTGGTGTHFPLCLVPHWFHHHVQSRRQEEDDQDLAVH
ncbi:hypothetical protein JOB18_040017 [Solea senegalensis]|uniref:Uncharacterized protein n=1 Tax=Solea senegalensis TaxID=28829 RepID=A0AAV6SI68_SOLSE|nr:hypothetical protein JOB18_040017 [Solea senegalensis]